MERKEWCERAPASAAEHIKGVDLAMQMMSVNQAATIATGCTGGEGLAWMLWAGQPFHSPLPPNTSPF